MSVHFDKQMQHVTGNGLQRPSSYPCYTLKIRCGKDTYIKADGSIGTAGKGALIQTELSATLGVSNDQYLFAPAKLKDE